MMTQSKIEKFEFEGLRYELVFKPNNEIIFGIVGGSSARYRVPCDLHAKWGTQNDFIVEDINGLKAPFSLIKSVLQSIYSWISSTHPGHFYFRAATTRKEPIYERLAERIANRMGYNFVRDGASLYFFRPATDGASVGRLDCR